MKRKYYFFFIIWFLCSCSLIKSEQRDSAPKKPLANLHKIPDAIPKKETFSKYGNPTSYSVFGKKYHVLKSDKNYKAKGIASWYGTKFHGQRTSSGEPYDMYLMTAAHKTLPIPTYAKVTNLENGKSIIVKINDRGPFHEDRIIDLSYVAAFKLGVLAKGTAPVVVETIDSDLKPNSYPEIIKANKKELIENLDKQKTKSEIYVQMGAFNDLEKANSLAEKIKTTIDQVLVKTSEVNGKKWYKVQIGPLSSNSNLIKITKDLANFINEEPMLVLN